MGIGRDSASEKDRYAGLARLLRDRRTELGLSRRDVVARTQLSYPYVSQLEGGYRAPSLSSARKLADALHLQVEDIVRAAGGDLPESRTRPPAAARLASGTQFRNPAYSAGIMQTGVHALAATVGSARGDAFPAAAAGASYDVAAGAPAALAGGTSADEARTPSGRSAPGDLEAVAEDVGRLLRRLPAESRLDALALAQSRLMAEMVQEQVRRATES
ncbi:helix-turn-helix transcriptional regulator [Georgenia daeguensis]|uniref:HTH cro/C1-type domain-containing protein n=1 Tax=Georgenia daeguensis TaxID=908355 RepID=A0ABP8EW17_9MICO